MVSVRVACWPTATPPNSSGPSAVMASNPLVRSGSTGGSAASSTEAAVSALPSLTVTVAVTSAGALAYVCSTTAPSPVPPSPKLQVQVSGSSSGSLDALASKRIGTPGSSNVLSASACTTGG